MLLVLCIRQLSPPPPPPRPCPSSPGLCYTGLQHVSRPPDVCSLFCLSAASSFFFLINTPAPVPAASVTGGGLQSPYVWLGRCIVVWALSGQTPAPVPALPWQAGSSLGLGALLVRWE